MTPAVRILAERFATPAAFLKAAGPFLQESEVENALILGVAMDLSERDPTSHPQPYFGCARDGDRILMCAFRSLADRAGITRTLDPAAIPILADAVHEECPTIREVVGPEPVIGEFARSMASLLGRRAYVRRASRIHVLETVRPPSRPAPGRLRIAVASDHGRVAGWIEGFLRDVNEEGDPRDIADRRIREKRLFLWEDGEPVSMAASSGKTPNGIRVNFVYTPPELRGRGYASACVAAMSQALLDAGNRYCCLYTDLANPTSNKIYREIGYEPVCDTASYGFDT